MTAATQGVAIGVLDAFSGGGSTCCPNTKAIWNGRIPDLDA
ncbi:MAG: hypothetical protein U0Y68_25245 [Blastocatellia bacterium]